MADVPHIQFSIPCLDDILKNSVFYVTSMTETIAIVRTIPSESDTDIPKTFANIVSNDYRSCM